MWKTGPRLEATFLLMTMAVTTATVAQAGAGLGADATSRHAGGLPPEDASHSVPYRTPHSVGFAATFHSRPSPDRSRVGRPPPRRGADPHPAGHPKHHQARRGTDPNAARHRDGGGTRHPSVAHHRPRIGPQFRGGPNGAVAGRALTRPGSPGHATDNGRNHHGGFVGWYGPVFWPYAYDDMFAFTFWPSDYFDYDGPFWAYAYDDTVAGPFGPYGYPDEAPAAEEGPAPWLPPVSAGRSRAGVRGLKGQSREFAEICGERPPGLTDWPTERMVRAVQPGGAQSAALDALKTVSVEAAGALDAACPGEVPTSPIGRLDAMELRLDAMLWAIALVRPAVETFLRSLRDDQQEHVRAMGAVPRSASTDLEPAVEGASHSWPARICGRGGADFARLAVARMAAVVVPIEDQRAALGDLDAAAGRAAELLRAACPASMPGTPEERLDAMRTRLAAMRDALETMRRPLAGFYAALSGVQKARLNGSGHEVAHERAWPARY